MRHSNPFFGHRCVTLVALALTVTGLFAACADDAGIGGDSIALRGHLADGVTLPGASVVAVRWYAGGRRVIFKAIGSIDGDALDLHVDVKPPAQALDLEGPTTWGVVEVFSPGTTLPSDAIDLSSSQGQALELARVGYVGNKTVIYAKSANQSAPAGYSCRESTHDELNPYRYVACSDLLVVAAPR